MPSTALEDEHISTLPSPENTSLHLLLTLLHQHTRLLRSNQKSETVQADTVLGCGCRTKKPSTRLTDFVINTVSLTPLTAPSPSSFLGMVYPIPNYYITARFSESHSSYLTALSLMAETKSYKEAMLLDVWMKAMWSKIETLELNHTWDLVELPLGKVALGYKWVYRGKLKADGTLERYKERLVFHGNNQIEGID